MDKERFERERQRILDQYALYEKENKSKTIWAPFHPKEAAYRCQQYLMFSRYMSQINRSDLSEWKILDVGCGRGRILRSFLDMGATPNNLFGVDLNEKHIQEGRAISPNINLETNNGTHLPFKDGSFNLVTQHVVFSSIMLPEMRHTLALEMRRVLKPGGYIFWWDLPQTAHLENFTSQALKVSTLFPKAKIIQKMIGAHPQPSATLRKFRCAKVVGRILDHYVAVKPTHVAALIGPKE